MNKRPRLDSMETEIDYNWDYNQNNIYVEPWCLMYEINIWQNVIDDNMHWCL